LTQRPSSSAESSVLIIRTKRKDKTIKSKKGAKQKRKY